MVKIFVGLQLPWSCASTSQCACELQNLQSSCGTQKGCVFTEPGTCEMKSFMTSWQAWSGKHSKLSTQVRRHTP